MKKSALNHGLTGCLARIILLIVVEILTTAICVKVFDMGEIPTYCANFAMICVVCAFAAYYDKEYNGITTKRGGNKSEEKIASGCFVIVALFFLGIAVHFCSAERERQQVKQTIKRSSPTPLRTDTTHHKTKRSTNTFIPTDDEEAYEDLYDNPDFDDLIPGDEYDEEFVDRSEGDPELYDRE